MRFGRTRRWGKVFLSVAALVGALPAVPLLAAIPDDELAKLKDRIVVEQNRAAQSLIDPKLLASQLFLPYPVNPPTRTKEEVKAEVDKAVAAAAQAKFAELNEDYYKAMAVKRYPVYKEYETATVVKTDGTTFKDIVRDIGADTVRIGNQVLRYSELSEQSQVNFSQDLAQQRRATFVRQKLQNQDQERKLYEHALRDEIEKKFYEGAGYLLIRGEWVPASDYLGELVQTTKEAYRDRLKESVTNKVYSEAGYVLYNGEWMKPVDRAKLTAPPPDEAPAPAPVEAPKETPKEAPKDVPTGKW